VFGDYGQVLEIHTQEDGTAIVEFEDQRDAQDAAEGMDGKKIAGALVSVKVRQDGRGGFNVRSGIDDRITEMAHRYQLDATSTARLVSAFRDRSRRGCNLDLDIKQLSEHLAASNKPSALVCMKLADLREGKPIGPCKYSREAELRDSRRPGDEDASGRARRRSRSRSRRRSRERDRDRDRDRDREHRERRPPSRERSREKQRR